MSQTAVDLDLERFLRLRDEGGFRAIYRRCTPRLYGLALRLEAGASEVAEDLVQETWIRAVRKLDSFSGRSRFETWLCGILVNCHREGRRQRATRRNSSPGEVELEAIRDFDEAISGRRVRDLAGPFSPTSAHDRGVNRIDLERAVQQLPEGYRQVLVLHDVFGHTHEEIARQLDIRAGTSKSQLARARAKLRALLVAGEHHETAWENER